MKSIRYFALVRAELKLLIRRVALSAAREEF
jgi:hypothetical protein